MLRELVVLSGDQEFELWTLQLDEVNHCEFKKNGSLCITSKIIEMYKLTYKRKITSTQKDKHPNFSNQKKKKQTNNHSCIFSGKIFYYPRINPFNLFIKTSTCWPTCFLFELNFTNQIFGGQWKKIVFIFARDQYWIDLKRILLPVRPKQPDILFLNWSGNFFKFFS